MSIDVNFRNECAMHCINYIEHCEKWMQMVHHGADKQMVQYTVA